jgi:hypothetical protein
MKCQICGNPGNRIQVLKGPGKNPTAVILCVLHKKGFEKWKKTGGKNGR